MKRSLSSELNTEWLNVRDNPEHIRNIFQSFCHHSFVFSPKRSMLKTYIMEVLEVINGMINQKKVFSNEKNLDKQDQSQT